MILNNLRFRVILLICIVINPFDVLGQMSDDYSRPIDISESIAEIQSSVDSSCYLGLGHQNNVFNISNQKAEPESYHYLADYDSAPGLLFGCYFKYLEVGFAINHVSTKLSHEISYQNEQYNSITYYQNTASIGYLAHIWLNHFYMSSGLSYSYTKYQLGYFNSETGDEYSNDMKYDSQWMAYLNFLGVLTPSLFINFKYQQSFSEEQFIQEQTQLGFNFYTSF